jgi:hypothetical protein
MPVRVASRGDRIKEQHVSLKDFNSRRNRVLIMRGTGGLGDILMHRMLFEDFKLLVPDIKVCFACPRNYFPAVEDHPFVDELVDFCTVDPTDYLLSYITTTACGRYENKVAPYADKHRADIWADHCGIKLTRHNMHFRLRDHEVKFGQETLARFSGGRPVALLAPISAMTSKNLDSEQMNGVAREMRKMGFSVVCIHNTPVPEMKDAPVWHTNDIRKWMGVIFAADAVVSVDTAIFHCAGGMHKPLVGIFSWADGLAYGKWFDFVLVQKHRSFTPSWGCGPCYKWHDCLKCPSTDLRKPCITEVSVDDIMTGVSAMVSQRPQLRSAGVAVNSLPDLVGSAGLAAQSACVAVVAAADSVADRPARVELPVLQAIG